eukprot:TRINITY_DN6694_c0_g2_i1.p1 TRINITY_DN6694_c0_g2~~TRINITY_DN6694_c0_g2_i1.p1  ORF type:complete len:125 (-),score=12.34 TRINITY_DN6694_c0_g2_i1:187-561(-)
MIPIPIVTSLEELVSSVPMEAKLVGLVEQFCDTLAKPDNALMRKHCCFPMATIISNIFHVLFFPSCVSSLHDFWRKQHFLPRFISTAQLDVIREASLALFGEIATGARFLHRMKHAAPVFLVLF